MMAAIIPIMSVLGGTARQGQIISVSLTTMIPGALIALCITTVRLNRDLRGENGSSERIFSGTQRVRVWVSLLCQNSRCCSHIICIFTSLVKMMKVICKDAFVWPVVRQVSLIRIAH